jgi:N-acetylmuramic acid 6-phosphate (MurNAc-6-P) etherase
MLKLGCSRDEAEQRLADAGGFVRAALAPPGLRA